MENNEFNNPNLPTNFKSIGTILKEAREKKEFSLKKISHQTKINLTLLEALEENQLDKLPNKAYVTGFVKSYAQVLGLDSNDCVEILEKTYQNKGPSRQVPRASVLKEPEIQENSTNWIFTGAAAALIIIGVSVYFINAKKKIDKSKLTVTSQQVSENSPLKNNASVPEVTTPAPTAVVTEPNIAPGQNEKKALVVKVEAPPVVSKKVESKIEIKKQVPQEEKNDGEKKEEKKLSFRSIPEKLYEMAEDKNQELLKQYVPMNMQSSVISDKQNVFINAVDGDTWITYKKDDDAIKQFVLKKDKNILIRGDEIRLFLGNVNATKIFLNNDPISLQSRSGVKSLVFPQSAAKRYHIPLFVFEGGNVMTSDEYLSKKEGKIEEREADE